MMIPVCFLEREERDPMKPELLRSLKHYDKSDLSHDLLAGLMVAIIALPLSIALGLQSGATLQTGILTAIVAGFFISLLGGSRYQIGGPTAAFVVIILGYLQDPQIGFTGLALATLAAGVLLVILGFCRAGALVRFIPYPIVIGFTTGIGITLLTGQLKDLTGLTMPAGAGGGFVGKLAGCVQGWNTVNPWTLAVGALTVVLIYLLPKLSKKLPAAFCAIVIATLVTLALDALTGGRSGIATIGSTYGDVKAQFNGIDLSGLGTVAPVKLIVPALVIAFLCAIESLLSATVADGMTGSQHDPNQELVGQGVANIASALAGGLPATGAIARTAAGINSGARSPLTGIFHALFLLAMYVVLMPVMRFIPLTGLAAILITVSIRMANFPVFLRLTTFGVRDCVVLVVTCLLTVFFDLTYGVIGGFILCCALNAPNLIAPAKVAAELPQGGQLTAKLEGKLCFMGVVGVHDYLLRQSELYDELALDLADIPAMDVTSAERLSKLSKRLATQGKSLALTNAAPAVQARFTRFQQEILER